MSSDDAMLDEIQKQMLKAEEKVMDEIPELTLEELINFYSALSEDIYFDTDCIEIYRNSSQEAILSTFRVIKAILAEIEYRIKENIQL